MSTKTTSRNLRDLSELDNCCRALIRAENMLADRQFYGTSLDCMQLRLELSALRGELEKRRGSLRTR